MSAAATPYAPASARASVAPTGSQTPALPAPPPPAQLAVEGPLEIQHVATAANDIRLKIQKARRAVTALPDMDRTCEDQEDEIEDLEARIARLKASLNELGRPVAQAEDADGDQSMTG